MTKPKIVIPKGKRLLEGKWLVPAEWKDWHAYLHLFGKAPNGEGRFAHFKKLIPLLWPEPVFIQDEWSDLFFAACCGAGETVEKLTGVKIDTEEDWCRRICATGAGSTGKSAKAAMYMLCCWLCDQRKTTVVLTSTGMEQLKRRIWHALLKWINECKEELPLETLPSDCEIRWAAGDKLSCIFGIPVKIGGEESDAVDRIKGLHNTATFLVIDEATAMPDAIVEAERNLRKGTKRHQVIVLGNATKQSDLHGRSMEPVNGWNSITVEDAFWLNKLGGCSVHFDGHKSPRLRDDDRYPYYIGAEDIRLEQVYNGGESNPRYWSEVRGFWPPTGLSNTVMDEAMLVQFGASEKAVWKSGYEMGAAFDGAWEGADRAVLYPFRFGAFQSGTIGLEFMEPIIISSDTTQDKRWIHYSIADNVQRKCEELKVPPQNFMEDTTGEGGAFHSILSARWSSRIRGVEFGGAADKTLINAALPETWHDRYGNRVAMIWFMLRAYVEGGQVRGLTDAETRKELCSRQRLMKNSKIHVEPKAKMKGRSPDKADAACIATFFMYDTGRLPSGITAANPGQDIEQWNSEASKLNVDDEEAYAVGW